MNRDSIKKKCTDYIEGWRNSNPEYALMITGEWGCGKTFFCKEIIEERNKESGIRLAWYISAFGVKNAEDFNDKLFEAAHPILGNSKNKKYLSVGYNILKSAVKYKLNIDTNKILKAVGDCAKSKDENPSGCQVLFVDDIERTDMKIEDLFGYFFPFVEGGTRVIFIANENEMKNSDSYKIIKEKIIGETYSIIPKYKKCIESFWNNMDNDMENAEYYKEKIAYVFKTLDVKNLRIAKYVIHQWLLFYQQVPKEYKNNKKYLQGIFEIYIVLMIKYYMQKIKIGEKIVEDDIIEQIEKCWDEYKEKVVGRFDSRDITIYHLAYDRLWLHIVLNRNTENQFLKDDLKNDYKIYTEREKQLEKNSSNLSKMLKFVFYRDDKENGDIKECFKSLVNEINEGKYKKFSDIMSYIQIYNRLSINKIIPDNEYNFDKLAKQLELLIDNIKSEKIKIQGGERLVEEKLLKIGNVKINKVIVDIFKAVIEKIPVDNIFSDKDEFLKFISVVDNAYNKYSEISFLQQMDIDTMFSWLGDDMEEHKKLLKFLTYRYRKTFSNSTLQKNDYADLSLVKDLYEKYNKYCTKLEGKYRVDLLDYQFIKKAYKEMIEYMEGIIKNDKK